MLFNYYSIKRFVQSIVAIVSVTFLVTSNGSAQEANLWVGQEYNIKQYSLDNLSPTLSISTSDKIESLAIDGNLGRVWSATDNTLRVYDFSGQFLFKADRPTSYSDEFFDDGVLSINPETSEAWVGANNKLYKYSPTGTLLKTISVYGEVEGISFDKNRNEIWVATKYKLTIHNASSGDEITSIGLGSYPKVKGIVYDSELNEAWVINRGKLKRYNRSGQNTFTSALSYLKRISLSKDSVWVSSENKVYRVAISGAILAQVSPIQNSYDNEIESIVADSKDDSLWVAGEHKIVHVDSNGVVTQQTSVYGEIETIALYRDITPPTLSINTPSNGELINTNQPAFEFTLSDSGSGIDTDTLTAKVNDVEAVLACTYALPIANCTVTTAFNEGVHAFSAQVSDLDGNASIESIISFTVDTIAPQITITSPLDGSITNQAATTILGSVDEAATVTINSQNIALSNNNFNHDITLVEGINTFSVTSIDNATNMSTISISLTLDTVPPVDPDAQKITITDLGNGNIEIKGTLGSVEPGATLKITNTRTGEVFTVVANADGSFTLVTIGQPGDIFTITVVDKANNSSGEASVELPNVNTGLPPEPSTVASVIDTNEATTVFNSTSFLYTGANPIQTGMAPEVIDVKRAAVIRGRVLAKNNSSLSGVTITIKNHSEYGQTLTRTDGRFDLAVNGGGSLVVNYAKQGYLTVQRKVTTPWQNFAHPDDIVMIPVDTNVTSVVTNSPVAQIAKGNPVTDVDGTRTATLMFPANTQATMTLPGGSIQPLTTLNVRATEYTVGANGPQAMPASLPSTSAYTYAVELSVDEALSVNASSVNFNKPISFYVDNFLNMPVGVIVPVGFYDKSKAQWLPENNGLIIKVLSVGLTGMALLDITGDDIADDEISLAGIGITNEERIQIANQFAIGKSFWRMQVTHFSPYDLNYPFGLPADAINVIGQGPDDKDDEKNPDEECGSIIECQNQVLGESIDINGTNHRLDYRSNRIEGYKAAYTLNIPLTDSRAIPASLNKILLNIEIAGKKIKQSFTPSANLSTTFIWDGLDTYGRKVLGKQKATINIGYVYDAAYAVSNTAAARSFGLAGGMLLTSSRDNLEFVIWNQHNRMLGSNISEYAKLGGFTLDVHHHYSVNSGELYYGNGITLSNTSAFNMIKRVAGVDQFPFNDGKFEGIATEVMLQYTAIDFGPDGNLYIAHTDKKAIHKVDENGYLTTIAVYPLTDGTFYDVAVADDGTVYATFSSYDNNAITGFNRIYKVYQNGTLELVAGGGTETQEGVLAINAKLRFVNSIDIGRDGSIYLTQDDLDTVKKVTTDGRIYTIAGTGIRGFSGDGGIATKAQFNDPFGVVVGSDDSIYIADARNKRIRKVSPDGVISTIAGTGSFSTLPPLGEGGPAIDAELYFPWKLAIDSNDVLYISDYQFRTVKIDQAGNLIRISGIDEFGSIGSNGDGGNALLAAHSYINDIAVSPTNDVYISDWLMGMIQKISSPFARYATTDLLVASEDGSEIYQFDFNGKHLKTLNAKTNAVKYNFIYDANGYLSQVVDGDSNTLTINRDSTGNPLSIVSPDGQLTTLQLDVNGRLAKVTNPANESYTMVYTLDGLLTQFEDPNTNTSVMEYEADGRLRKDTNAITGSFSLGWQTDKDGYTSTLTSELGRMLTYRVDIDKSGNRIFTNTNADGTVSKRINNADDSEISIDSDGTVTTKTYIPDPRFDMQAMFPGELIIKSPSGKTFTVKETRNVVLANPNDKSSLQEKTITKEINGSIISSTYNVATSTHTTVSSIGRTVSIESDNKSRIKKGTVAGLSDVNYMYDSRGRMSSIFSVDGIDRREMNYSYNGQGFLDTITDALSNTIKYEYDVAGRATKITLPDNRFVTYTYDKNGNITSIIPPGKTAHTFNYNRVNKNSKYSAPLLGTTATVTEYIYNLDKQMTTILRPNGDVIDITYDNGGRRNQMILPRGTIGYTYNANGKINTISDPDSGQLSYAYDGFLTLSETLTGQINGSITRTFDNDFRVSQLSVNGSTFNFGYDADGYLVQSGQLNLVRNSLNGFITGTALNGITTRQDLNPFGEMSSYTANDGASDIYQVNYNYDLLGRIRQKVETVIGSTHSYEYIYDVSGRLITVQRDGITTSNYTYDSNGNRLSHNGISGTYDSQDRLVTYATASYNYTLNGDLTSKTQLGVVTSYNYDTLGNLVKVTIPNDVTIDYIIDGLNRRVGKKVDGALVQGFIYDGQLNPVAELDGTGAVVSTFVYGSKTNIPDYMEKSGVVYRIISDHLGSPLLIINSINGSIIQQIEYDEFGNILTDTNPGFQPFGFAGGIYDQQSKLTRYGARDYDASIGRWTSKDLIRFNKGNLNFYGYVANDPINWVDENGFWRVAFGGRGSFFFGGVGGTIGGNVGFDSDWNACAQVQSCGRLGGGASIGLRATASAGSGTVCNGNSFGVGGFGTVGLGIIGSVSTNTNSSGTTATATLGVGGGVSGGAQACVTRSFCTN